MLSLLSLFFLLPAALGSPVIQIRDSPITVPLAARINAVGSKNFVEADRARARSLINASTGQKSSSGSKRAVVGLPSTNGGVSYTVSVGIGTPPTQYTLLVDTGSSNTWIGAGTTAYVQTSSSQQTPDSVSVHDSHSSFSGTEFTDTVTLGDGLVIQGQSIGVASQSTGFKDFDGVLGLGPVDLTMGTLSPDSGSTIPTVTDNLFSQGTITSNEVSLSFEPATSESTVNGEITFGGTDSSKFTGSITFAPITITSPASQYWGIDQSIQYGSSSTIMGTTAGILDSGTTLILLASEAFNAYQKATGGVLDDTTGLLRLTPTQFSNLESLFFTISGTTFEFTANAQVWPRALNSVIGGTADSVYLVVSNLGTLQGSGMDFVNGLAFLERFYTVYDTANQRVGFATTPFTDATTN